MNRKRKAIEFKPGDITDRVWSGDIVTKCRFIKRLEGGRLLFWDETFKCFRRAFWDVMDGEFILNGWDCSAAPFDS